MSGNHCRLRTIQNCILLDLQWIDEFYDTGHPRIRNGLSSLTILIQKNIVAYIAVSHDCIFPNNLLEGDWSGNSDSYVFPISNPLWPKYHILDDYDTLLKNSLKLLGFGNKDNTFSCRARGLSQNNEIVQHLLETGGRVLVRKWNTLVATTVAKDMATEGIN